jgi:methyltransferase (TIGR00027 family)
MHDERPSTTAALVACMRALAHDGFTTATGFQDPISARFLPRRWAALREVLRRSLARATPEQRSRAAVQIDAVALRILALDERLEAALARGVRQVVILGAGLDARAFRLAALRDAHVFEVDHPQTQAHKQRIAAALTPLAQALTFVPVDFEKDSLATRLAGAGHHPDAPTVWLWEGVVMYLTDASLRATLAAIVAASAAGSELLLHYNEPAARSSQTWAMNAVLSWWREPQIGQRSRARMAEELRLCGLELEQDSGQSDWARRFGAHPPEGTIARQSRIVVARRA